MGTEACASDRRTARVAFPHLPDAKALIHVDEYPVIVNGKAFDNLLPGDEQIVIPAYGPTSALHKEAFVIKVATDIRCVGTGRWLTV